MASSHEIPFDEGHAAGRLSKHREHQYERHPCRAFTLEEVGFKCVVKHHEYKDGKERRFEFEHRPTFTEKHDQRYYYQYQNGEHKADSARRHKQLQVCIVTMRHVLNP